MIDKRLKIFQLIWELKSFSAAAAMLGMSQPNATQQLQRLEKDLGVRLFDRDTKVIKLTPAGEILLKELVPLNVAAENLQLKINSLGSGICSYRLGGTQTAGNYVLPQLMAKFMRQNPRTVLHLSIDNTLHIAENLQKGLLELALVEGPFDRNLFLSAKCCDDELLPVGIGKVFQTDFSLTKYVKNKGRLLLRETGSGTRYYFDKFCLTHGIVIPSSQIIVVESFEATKELAAAGVGIAFLSFFACRAEVRQERLQTAAMTEGRILRELNFIYTPASDGNFVAKFIGQG